MPEEIGHRVVTGRESDSGTCVTETGAWSDTEDGVSKGGAEDGFEEEDGSAASDGADLPHPESPMSMRAQSRAARRNCMSRIIAWSPAAKKDLCGD